jgi:hypothetical protein
LSIEYSFFCPANCRTSVPVRISHFIIWHIRQAILQNLLTLPFIEDDIR